MKYISVLGSTGSVGTQALKVIARHSDKLTAVCLTAHGNTALIMQQVEAFKPRLCVVTDAARRKDIDTSRFPYTEFLFGAEHLITAATLPGCDIVLAAASGLSSLKAVLAAVKQKKRIALANKEILVAYGTQLMSQAQNCGAEVIPVDSEHSAIFQCLHGSGENNPSRIILTASGGALRDYSQQQLTDAKAAQALMHPNWNMGKKITVDSATLMNKGLEVIEAVCLFKCPPAKVECVIHPQSIIHSMVEFADSCVMAQLSAPSMELPISYAFFYPERQDTAVAPLDFSKLSGLTFYPPDTTRFPCLRLAYEAAGQGGAMPAVLAAADEYLVEKYIEDKIGFYDIPKYIEIAMGKFCYSIIDSPDSVYYIDAEVKRFLQAACNF